MCSIIARGTLTLNDQEEKIVPWYIWVGIVSYALVHLGCALLAFLILEDAFENYGSSRYAPIGVAAIIGGPITLFLFLFLDSMLTVREDFE
ncbi:MAG: hypothetical protein A3J10_02145 [Candidatus Sungbacteria bacterium RIFCSPLOWO2_02_FULL_54_10]|uniref:Uncharacterized protein n=2 Tax=Candidatus Sungiibacteriota TaxID=1817917 RepID=A0A1G2L4H7_9BACT|nr:MAG: hypothetical protein A2679_01895 [Candidatus Sungbacteria bacterium RIFCSPHIGHO2_01_FULL_54_26]OHA02836.1 MAG: hypothetical protein A3C92_01455 [Candidatus Sungbacteria bacterium RIFCSPHIGHO2_02_FULL_53_17]OHA06607.1 MAG: hypothetical protein A3B34_03810 [Candidatus Sungbacteria bacterium RIFCSPLOWO2_01_FULL_54_21]OHA12438.1 MAG: hypothetical protein A3J10_02145 [Candidatus Sungbacteria bacterium RIFCSPLOWO2_02_FULL_54_10]